MLFLFFLLADTLSVKKPLNKVNMRHNTIAHRFSKNFLKNIHKGDKNMDEYEICLGSTAIVVQYYSTETQEFIQEKQVEYCKTLGGDWTGVCYMFLAYSGDLQFSLVGQGKSAVETCDIIFQK